MSKPIQNKFRRDPNERFFRLEKEQKKVWEVPEKLILENLNRNDILKNSNGTVLHDGEDSGNHKFYSGLRTVSSFPKYFHGDWMLSGSKGGELKRTLFVMHLINDFELSLITWPRLCPKYPRARALKANNYVRQIAIQNRNKY